MEGPLRVVFVCANRRWTGGERAMTTAARGLAARGHDVVFAYDPRGPVRERLGVGACAVPIAVRNDADPIAILQLRRLIREHRADVVCVNTFRELKVGGAAARLAGRARVVNRRGAADALAQGRRERFLYRLLLDAVVRDSQWGCDVIRRENPWFDRPVLRARNGVDVAALAAVEPLPREALGATEGEVLVGVADRRNRWAGSPELAAAAVEAARRAEGRLPPIRLVVLGDTDVGDELRQRIAGAEERVRLSFLGPLPPAEALRVIATCDVFARPSRTDAISFAVLEAMAMGRPVIATAVGGLPEVVADGVTGVLVPPGDDEALARAIATLSADPALRRRMGSAGAARVAAEFSESTMIDEYEAAFRAVLRPRGEGGRT